MPRNGIGSVVLLAVLVASVGAVGSASAALDMPQKAQFHAAAPGAFAASVAIDGDTAIAGAPQEQIGSNAAQGAAYVYVRNGNVWEQQAKLTAPDGVRNDQFGSSVAVSGDIAIVGAIKASGSVDRNQGSAYVFTRNGTTWTLTHRLDTGPSGDAGDFFGCSIAFDGFTAVVGAFGHDGYAGAVWVFVRDGDQWDAGTKLVANDSSAFSQFGASVSTAGNAIIVGAPGDYSSQGAAYVFQKDGPAWSLRAKLTARPAIANGGFGGSVAIDRDTALIGSTCAGSQCEGAVYVFARNADDKWTQQTILTASDTHENDNFGASVALAGEVAVIGAPGEEPNEAGAAYVFTGVSATWTEQTILRATDAAAHDGLGARVALSKQTELEVTAIVGAPAQLAFGGAAYVFANTAPHVEVPSTAFTNENETVEIPFTVSDDETAADALTISVRVAQDGPPKGLLPQNHVSIAGTGGSYTLIVTPAVDLSGRAILAVSAGDGYLTTTRLIELTVAPAPAPPAPSAKP
jgi:hypothetical protein